MSLLPAVVLPAAGVARIVAAAQRAYRPSRHDADAAFEADLIWLIVSVVQGIAAGEPAAFLYDPQAGGFSRLAVSVTD